MVVSQVTYIDEDGNTQSFDVDNTEFAVELDGAEYRPEITTEVEIEYDGDNSSPRDQCGNMERSRVGSSGWLVRVTGIITANGSRRENLDLELFKNFLAPSDELTIVSEVINGTFVMSNAVITQPNDLVSVQTVNTDGEERAYEFQLQLGEESNDD